MGGSEGRWVEVRGGGWKWVGVCALFDIMPL